MLAGVALAWVAGLILFHLSYVEPSLDSQVERIERRTAAGWLSLANNFILIRQGELLHLGAGWADKVGLSRYFQKGAPAFPGETVPAAPLARRRVSTVLLCDEAGCVLSAWRVGEAGGLTEEHSLGEGTDLSALPIFRASPQADAVFGVSTTPLGLALFGRHAMGISESRPLGYLVVFRPLDDLLFAELSTIVGANLSLRQAPGLPAGVSVPRFGHVVWRDGDESLSCAQVFRDSTGVKVGCLVARGRALPGYRPASTLKRAMAVTVAWAVGFALLMILIIHVLVSGPTARLWGRVQRLRAGERVPGLARNLRGEAWALAREFEKVLTNTEKLSQTDSLTGLATRRSFQQWFDQEYRRSRRYNRPLALAIMDVDFLKAVNDALGHQAGDRMLKVFGEVISANVRSSDRVARLGGDEVAVLMPETTAAEAAKVAERIRRALLGKSVGRGMLRMSPTSSMGIVDMNVSGAETPEGMLDLADQALYAAKRAGRNRVVQAADLDQLAGEGLAPDRDRVDSLCKQLAGLDAKFKRLFVEAIGGLISALEARDVHTANHAVKVRRYATLMAEKMHLPDRNIQHIARAAMLHDIGKIALPDRVLLKEGKLTQEEWKLMRRHPVVSVRIMEGMEFLDQEIPAVRYHHEHFDGSGYPEGLAGSAIPLAARILCVADAFGAMTSSRAYRGGKSVAEALDELRRGRGTHFDPAVVDVFLKVVEETPITDETVADIAAAKAS